MWLGSPEAPVYLLMTSGESCLSLEAILPLTFPKACHLPALFAVSRQSSKLDLDTRKDNSIMGCSPERTQEALVESYSTSATERN